MTVEDDNHCGSYCLLSAGQKKICRRDQIRNTSGQQNKDHRFDSTIRYSRTREAAPLRINSGMKV
ncbi:Uncharacterized protein BM_BM1367 [Brugia malayi]|uniref:Uncharacterized protein n=1 Tax=Brugia malayi TaxID=6279 RepID=A0A4E9ER73_BRUMA|nr:Uncharacterized protein BM_BM1367 [Brugia malayi]VIO86051.1 Uncharacterized protein BM_BM1367 [Brugia malayi]